MTGAEKALAFRAAYPLVPEDEIPCFLDDPLPAHEMGNPNDTGPMGPPSPEEQGPSAILPDQATLIEMAKTAERQGRLCRAVRLGYDNGIYRFRHLRTCDGGETDNGRERLHDGLYLLVERSVVGANLSFRSGCEEYL